MHYSKAKWAEFGRTTFCPTRPGYCPPQTQAQASNREMKTPDMRDAAFMAHAHARDLFNADRL